MTREQYGTIYRALLDAKANARTAIRKADFDLQKVIAQEDLDRVALAMAALESIPLTLGAKA